MTLPPFSRRMLVIIWLAVALPALLLAGLSIFLTVRIVRAIEEQSTRYQRYMAQQVAEGFEQELLADLREAIAPAENVARSGGDQAAIVAALAASKGPFEEHHFVPLLELTDYLLLVVESQPLVYDAGGQKPGLRFAGTMLRDPEGQVLGAGGYWFDPHSFLEGHLQAVMEERLANNSRIYGGIESTRNLSVAVIGPGGEEVVRIRDPGNARTAATDALAGPFEGYAVRVTATPNAPVAWTARFVALEVAFIGLMCLAILGATLFGLRYTARQLELAQIKASFVSNVSHELKTPIALIRLAVDTLEMRRVSSREESEKFLRSISRETKRLNQLVDNILDFARLEAGQRAFSFQAVDLLEVVRETVDSFRPRLEDQGFALALDLPDSLPLVRGDSTALAQCLLNLLDNAMKYSRARREVRVSAAVRATGSAAPRPGGGLAGEPRGGPAVTVSVTDRGIGISPRDQKRIFEKFVRVEAGLVHEVKGAGLGLSLVDQIIRAHGGRVEVTSVPGEGSTFTLVLPAAEAAQAPSLEPRAEAAS